MHCASLPSIAAEKPPSACYISEDAPTVKEGVSLAGSGSKLVAAPVVLSVLCDLSESLLSLALGIKLLGRRSSAVFLAASNEFKRECVRSFIDFFGVLEPVGKAY